MTRPFTRLLSSVFSLCAIAALAAQAPTPDNPLEPLAWLVGGTWVAETKTPDGNLRTIESTYEWASQKKAMKFSTIYKNNDQTILIIDSMYLWHPGQKQILMIQPGSILTESVVRTDGGKLLHDNTLTRANGTTDRQRAEFIREGDDSFLLKASVLNGEQWKEVVTFTYKRRSSPGGSIATKPGDNPGATTSPARTSLAPKAEPRAPAPEAKVYADERPGTRKLDELTWMVGSWLERKAGVETEEHWTAPKGDVMLGMNRTARESGRTSFEFLRIARTATGISYFASPGGRSATEFKLGETAEKEPLRRVVFENREHDFPQRIIYWRDDDGSLHARIEGTIGGQSRSQEWTWRPMAKQ